MIDLDSMDLDSMDGADLRPTFIKYTQHSKGDILLNGIYLGTTPNRFNENKPNHLFEIKGKKRVVLPSAGQLDYILNNEFEKNDIVRVIFEGKEVLERGAYQGKEVNCFKVLLLQSATPSDVVFEEEKAPEPKTPETVNLDNLE